MGWFHTKNPYGSLFYPFQQDMVEVNYSEMALHAARHQQIESVKLSELLCTKFALSSYVNKRFRQSNLETLREALDSVRRSLKKPGVKKAC